MSRGCRDPVTQLAMVPPEAMDRGARNAFRQLLHLRNTSIGLAVIPVVLYYSPIVRRTRHGGSTPCYLLVSRTHWYICKSGGKISRCCRVEQVAKVLICRDSHVVWNVQQERDVVIRFEDATEIPFVTNLLRVLKATVAGGVPLAVVSSGLDYTKLSGPDKVQLEGKSQDDGEWPLPVVLADEAYRQHTVEEVMMGMRMMMPPPPSPPSPSSSPPSGATSALLPVSAATRDTHRESRIHDILHYMDGFAAVPFSPDPPATPVAAPPPAAAPAAAGAVAVSSEEEEEEVVVAPTSSEGAMSSMVAASSTTIRQIRKITSATDTAAADPAAEQSASPPPPPPPRPRPLPHMLMPEAGISGGQEMASCSSNDKKNKHTFEVRSLLRELCDVESRVTSLERLQRLQAHGHGDSTATPAQESVMRTATISPRGDTPGSLPASPFLRLPPPPRISTQTDEPLGMDAAEFERRISTRTVAERIILRKYEIDEKLRLTSACIKGGDVQQLLLVARLQETVLPVLLEAQRADERQQQQQCLTSTKSLHRIIGGSGDGEMEKKTDNNNNNNEEEEEEEEEELRDYGMWAATDIGRRWYEEHFGEHLSACKVKMVQEAFERGVLPS